MIGFGGDNTASISITSNSKKVARALKDTPKRIPIVMSKAINRTANDTVKAIARVVAKKLGYKQRTIKKMMPINRSNKNTLQARILLRDMNPKIIDVDSNPKWTDTGVTYKLGRERKERKHAFVQTMPTGHKGVFIRPSRGSGTSHNQQGQGDAKWSDEYAQRKDYFAKQEKGRLKITELYAPSMRSSIIGDYEKEYRPIIKKLLEPNIDKELKREIAYQQRKAKKR